MGAWSCASAEGVDGDDEEKGRTFGFQVMQAMQVVASAGAKKVAE